MPVKNYTITPVKIYSKVMYLVKATLCGCLVCENIFSTELVAQAWVEHMKQLDREGR